MSKISGFAVAYTINGIEHMAYQSDENIRMTPNITEVSPSGKEICLTLVNCSGQDIYLNYVTLMSAENVEELNIGAAPYTVYRSGRHKNDMPGTFTLGVEDERLGDVLGAMTESGDKASAVQGTRRVISDHLTIIKGSEKSLLIEFPGGRKQLFETVLSLDDEFELQSVNVNVIFNRIIAPGEMLESEAARLIWTDDVEGEVEHFAVEKAEKFGSRCGKRPAVFCTW